MSEPMLTREELQIILEMEDNAGLSRWHSIRLDRLKEMARMALGYLAMQPRPTLHKYQPCGCVVCTCENDEQCQGCGAKHCGTHPVGKIPHPLYITSLPEPKI